MLLKTKKALLQGAFFVLWFGLAPTTLVATTEFSNCPDLPIAGTGQIKYIYDGDTVKLKDGRKVRLLGINTPEISHEQQDSEPFAKAAQRRLTELIPLGTTVSLQLDQKHQDSYGRLLAHLQRVDGSNPALTLLAEGLATILIIPPNTTAATCFAAAERSARNRGSGLWSHPDYWPTPAASLSLPGAAAGYRVIRGEVTEVTASKRFYHLDINGRLSLHISKQDWRRYFTTPFSPYWPGAVNPLPIRNQSILLRGWLRPDQRRTDGPLQMRLYHPAGLEWRP